ncbi:hypothetical protein J0H58_21640 [bacterium]|nr:hypothetical protein [bacterium]
MLVLPDGFVLAPAAEFEEAAARLKEWEDALAVREAAVADRAKGLDDREAALKTRTETAPAVTLNTDVSPPETAAAVNLTIDGPSAGDAPLSGGAIPPAVSGPAKPPAVQAKKPK